jgi:RNA polymerase sigma-70 factor, ECF subfamily
MSLVNLIFEPPPEVSANELAVRAQRGDQAAYSDLAIRYRPRLLRALRHRLGGSYADAEDVAQEALTAAWQRISTFNPRYQFTTWLYTIAFRLATDFHRRGRRHDHERISAASEIVDIHQRPADQMVASREDSTNLWSTASQELVPAQFTALWLRYGEGLSVGETAEVLGKTKVGVRVLLHRARLRLEPHLVPYLAGDPPTEPSASCGRPRQESNS